MAEKDRIGKQLRVVEKTGAYTVVSGVDSGTVFIGNHATTQVAFTVPIGQAGDYYYFLSKGAAGISVASSPADKLVFVNDAAGDSVALSTESQMIGGGFMVFSDGSLLYATTLGNCGSMTVTTAT